MVELINKIFIGLLTDIASASNHSNSMSLSNRKCIIQSTLTNLYPKESGQKFHYNLFTAKLNRSVGSCKTLNDSSNKVCAPSKRED